MDHTNIELEAVKSLLIHDHYLYLNSQLEIISFSTNCIEFCKSTLKTNIQTTSKLSSLLVHSTEDLSVTKIESLLLFSNIDHAIRIPFTIGSKSLLIHLLALRESAFISGYSCIIELLPDQETPNNILENLHLINSLTWFTSHKLRGPLAAILGLIDQNPLIEITQPMHLESLLQQMKQQATTLDEALHTLHSLLSSNDYTAPVVTKMSAKSFKNILLLDDELLLHKICVKIVAEINPDINMFCFMDGYEALEFLESFPVDLILLDLNMPIMNGWEFLDRMRNNGVKTSTLIVSSSIDNKDVNRSLEYNNVKGFLNKPISKDDLKSILHNSLPLTYA